MRLWVDADAAPRDVKEIVFRAARRLEIPAVLVANQWISTPMDHPFVTAVRVAGGPDVADRHIAEHAEPGDVAVTADIPLAARRDIGRAWREVMDRQYPAMAVVVVSASLKAARKWRARRRR